MKLNRARFLATNQVISGKLDRGLFKKKLCGMLKTNAFSNCTQVIMISSAYQ